VIFSTPVQCRCSADNLDNALAIGANKHAFTGINANPCQRCDIYKVPDKNE
jgi:hypothetical protein